MNKRKKMIRLGALVGVLLIAVVGFVLHFSIEPADYRGSVQKAVTAAAKLADSVQIGNENGQYSANTVAEFRRQIDAAQKLLDAGSSTISEEKQQCESLKAATKQFPKEANQNSLSAEELGRLKEEKEKLTREVEVSGSSKAEWEIDLSSLSQSAAINFDIRPDSAFQEEIDAQLKQEGVDGTLLSLRHNGALPTSAVIRYDYSPAEEGTAAYLYHFNENEKTLTYSAEIALVNNRAVLLVDEGGDWVITNQKFAGGSDGASSADSSQSEPGDAASSSSDAPAASSDSAAGSAPAGQASQPETSPGGLQNDGAAGNGTAEPGGGAEAPGQQEDGSQAQKYTCTIEIRCDTILDNMESLKPEKAGYVPADGVILSRRTVEFYEGDTTFDVLKRVTRDNKIQMEYEMRALYSGAYIKGLGNLYEKDCGGDSGWIYKVNGWPPNYGISNYTLKDGDEFLLVYTCNGAGADVGAGR